jgi:hypothetical protein
MQERAVNDARADAAGHFSPQVLLSLSFTKQAIRIIAQYCIVILLNCVQIPELHTIDMSLGDQISNHFRN